MPITQDNRMLRIATPLDDNAVVLSGFSGNEGLSVPFSFELNLVSESDSIAFDEIIGKNITISIGEEEASARFFNGIVSRFSQDSGTGDTGLAHYSATVVPWFWLLSKTTNSRIFQDKSVPDIVEELFTEKGFNDFLMELDGTYAPKEYCVQYAETDFNFVSRLLEQEGIFYFFKHENSIHTMVLGDSPGKHPECPLNESVVYRSGPIGGSVRESVITDLDKWQEIRIGKYTVNDFNFKLPNNDLLVGVENQTPLGPGVLEVYDFPAEYKTRAEGERLANIRMQAEEMRTTSFSGSSTCGGFTGGYKYNLSEGHYRSEMNGQTYVLTSVNHRASEPAGGSSAGGGSSFLYTNKFTCIPFEVPYRPAFITPKPMIPGVQTAIVVGPAGEQIHTDEYGRVKVQFPWDRNRQFNEDSSCWIRVSQTQAGTGWGAMFLPRIGQEAIVDFLEGDPDRPIITGCVYNGLNTPPYSLPDEKTKSAIKTISVPDNGGTNEIRFEDKADEEQLFIQAAKTFDIRVNDKSREHVGENRHLIVTENQLEKVDGDKHLKVAGDHKESVSGTISIQAESGDILLKTGGNFAVDASSEVHIKAGSTLIIEAGSQLSLKVGGSFVNIGPAGVDISGSMVKINSGGSAASGSGCSPDSPDEPEEADTADPGSESELPSLTPEEVSAMELTPQAISFSQAAENGTPLCET